MLSPKQSRLIATLAKEQAELRRQLAELEESLRDLGGWFAQELGLPEGAYSFFGEEDGRVRLIVHYEEPKPREAEPAPAEIEAGSAEEVQGEKAE
jgi:hypothetical protein